MFSSVFLFQLYNEVQARRGASDSTADNQKNGSSLECGLGHHGNGLFAPVHHSGNHAGDVTVPHHYSNSCNYSPNGYSYPRSHQNGYGHCHSNGVSEIGDLLQDYLGTGKQMSRKNNGARHVVSRGVLPTCASFCWYLHIGRNKIRGHDTSQSCGCGRNILITVTLKSAYRDRPLDRS